MKKLLLFALGGSVFLISCNNESASSSGAANATQQKNLAADSTIGEAFRTGDASKIDSVVAADFVDHTDQGDKNRDSLKTMIKMMHDSFPDMKMDLVNTSASGDYVYAQMRFTGNSNGSMGMSKGPYDMHMIEVSKYKDGKAVEHWSYMEMRDVMKMAQDMMKMTNNPAGNSKNK